jgi:hypothetical protein
LPRALALYAADTCLCSRSLPGSVNERQLLGSFSRMLPGARLQPTQLSAWVCTSEIDICFVFAELLRFSSASHILQTIPQELQDHHRVKEQVAPSAVALKPATLGRARKLLVKGPEKQAAKTVSIWDGWDDAGPSGTGGMEESEDELDLHEFGL